MANQNPIKTADPGPVYMDFFIPGEFAEKTICLSTKTELDRIGWDLDLAHALALDGEPLDFYADPDINQTKIGRCSDLAGKKLFLTSKAARIRNGGDPPPPGVIYTLTLADEAGNIIGEFTKKSDETNPVKYHVKITLKMES